MAAGTSPASEKTLADVVIQLEENNDKTEQLSTDIINFRFDIVSQLTTISEVLRSPLDKTVDLLTNILNLQLDDSAAAREAAREAARASKGKDDAKGTIKDAKADEAKAGGFFSKLSGAVMNPMKAMGAGMKSIGKGTSGFLEGLAKGLMAFANPLILKGVAILSISLPILAAGLAAAFKVFELIAGEGKALKIITGIIKSLGEAIGTILQKVLVGFGMMIKTAGPAITLFFNGIATVLKALEPIITKVFKVIKDIITDPVFNKTLQKVLDVVAIGLQELSKVIQKVGDVIISVVSNISKILDSVFNGIAKIIKTIGDTIATVIDSIVGGIERLAVLPAGNMLKVAAGLTAMAGALVLFSAGAAIAGAIMPSADTLERVADSVLKFANIEPGNLKAVGDGMTAVGIGLGVFGVGGKLADLLKVEGGGLESVADSVSKFGKIDATNFAMVGDGIKKLGVGLAAFGGGGAISALGDAFSGWIGGDKDPTEQFKKFAEIGPGVKDAADGISGLAAAFDLFNDADPEKAGKAINKFAEAVDPAAIAKLKDSLAGLSSEKLLAGGIYKMEPVMGQFETGGIVPKTGTYKLHKDEMVVDNNAMEVFKAGTQILSSLQTGQELAGLQRESNQLTEGGGAPIIVNSPQTTQINQNEGPGFLLPPSPISPNQSDIPSTLD